jgi:hypothetical protein
LHNDSEKGQRIYSLHYCFFNGVRDYIVVGGTFAISRKSTLSPKNAKEPSINRTKKALKIDRQATTERTPAVNRVDCPARN